MEKAEIMNYNEKLMKNLKQAAEFTTKISSYATVKNLSIEGINCTSMEQS